MTDDLLSRLTSAAADVTVLPGDDFARGVRRRARTLARRRTAARAGVVAGVVAVGGGGAGALALRSGGPGRVETIAPAAGDASASAQVAADRAALLAQLDDQRIASAPYWYVAARTVGTGSGPHFDLTDQSWLGHDGVQHVHPDASEHPEQSPPPAVSSVGSVFPDYDGRQLTWDGLATLPTDPLVLLDHLDRQVAATGSAATLPDILVRYAGLPLPHAQRLALEGAARATSNAWTVSHPERATTDSLGRAALAVSLSPTRELLFDDGGHLLEQVTDDHRGELLEITTYLVQGPVDGPTATIPLALPAATSTAIPCLPLPQASPAASPSPSRPSLPCSVPGGTPALEHDLDLLRSPSPDRPPLPLPTRTDGAEETCASLATALATPAPAPTRTSCPRSAPVTATPVTPLPAPPTPSPTHSQ